MGKNAENNSAIKPCVAMLLAAGRGERMRPLTDTIPKPLVKVGGKALIEWHLQALHDSGVSRVVVNHAYLGSQIVAAIGNGSRYGLEINYSAEPEGGLETAGGIMRALPLLGEKPFAVVNADIWTNYDFASLRAGLNEGMLAHLVMVDTPTYKPRGDFYLSDDGIIQLEGVGKSLTFAGISLQSPQLFHSFQAGRLALLPVLKKAIAENKVSGEYFCGEWQDIGTLQRLQKLQSELH